jgi:hypothetical protein
MIKVSASNLDQYLKYESGVISDEMLIESLTSRSEPSLKMQIGTEFHESIENVNKPCTIFQPKQLEMVRGLFSAELNGGIGVHELKARGVISTDLGKIVITGMADLLIGNKVVEFKTTFGSFSIDRYFESLQWQVYATVFGVDVVEYVVFEFPNVSTKYKTIQDIEASGVPLEFTAMHRFPMHSSMVNFKYLRSVATDLYKFIKARRLELDMEYVAAGDSAEFIGELA